MRMTVFIVQIIAPPLIVALAAPATEVAVIATAKTLSLFYLELLLMMAVIAKQERQRALNDNN